MTRRTRMIALSSNICPLPAEAATGERQAPRLLVVGAVVPGARNVGEIILRDMCCAYPPYRMSCLGLTRSQFDATTMPTADWVEVRTVAPKWEQAWRPVDGRWGTLTACAVTQTLFRRHVRKLVDQAVVLGRLRRAEKVFLILNSASTIAMGAAVAERLGVPLVSLVWDPPDYLLRSVRMDRISRALLLRRFGDALRVSERVGVVSKAMQSDYARDFAAKSVLVRHGLEMLPAAASETQHPQRDCWVIGFAGALYAPSAWAALMDALDLLQWRAHGRRVVVRMLGTDFRFRTGRPANIEFCGFHSPAETVRILSGCDAAYLPQPFESALHELARYSFPTKLSTYLAAGRPILIHAPEHASLAEFYGQFAVGARCSVLDPNVLAAAIESLAEGTNGGAVAEVSAAARTEFSHEAFLGRTADLFGVDRDVLLRPASQIGLGISGARRG